MSATPYVLVVDDNKITTKLLKKYLESYGYEVDKAYDGIECLEQVEKRRPDAIILDVMMPRLDGYDTVRRLKSNSETATIPVVIVTALNDVSNQLTSIDAGADDFLSKPIEEKLLEAKVKLLTKISLESKRANAYAIIIDKLKNGELNIDSIDDSMDTAVQ